MTEAEGVERAADITAFLRTLHSGEYSDQMAEQVGCYLAQLKSAASSSTEDTAGDASELVRALLAGGAPEALTRNLVRFPFQVRKDVAKLNVSLLLYRESPDSQPGIAHLTANPSVVEAMVHGYDSDAADVALISGSMLREVAKSSTVAEQILDSEAFISIFNHLLNPNFDVASDAFDSFKELLTNTSNKQMVAAFLEEKYQMFFEGCNKVLTSDHFLGRLQLMKLLGELLFDRSNFSTMKRYISEPINLKLVMQLLKDKSNKISSEAFNVFKIFVANPEKAPGILEILLKNRTKLLEFIGDFEPDEASQQFDHERKLVIDAIANLSS